MRLFFLYGSFITIMNSINILADNCNHNKVFFRGTDILVFFLLS